MTATPAEVAAVMEVLGCDTTLRQTRPLRVDGVTIGGGVERVCRTHPYPHGFPEEGDRGCPVAAAAADAAREALDIPALIRQAKAEAVLAALVDLDQTEISRDDADGYAGTFMKVLYGGDDDVPEHWRMAWEWSNRFTGRGAPR